LTGLIGSGYAGKLYGKLYEQLSDETGGSATVLLPVFDDGAFSMTLKLVDLLVPLSSICIIAKYAVIRKFCSSRQPERSDTAQKTAGLLDLLYWTARVGSGRRTT